MSDTKVFHLDDQTLPWREDLSIAAVVARQGQSPEAVATALNGQFVPLSQREQTLLQPGDHLLFFQAIVGG